MMNIYKVVNIYVALSNKKENNIFKLKKFL